ncbi:MAG: hypothetical protein QY326_05760 [Bdellovibrionota bacterium]|nr:MAG: hypothetical protein QY326_05760 [Bdellovibrionota bacterium]
MNTAHLHLMLVHIPVVLVPIATLIYLYGVWRQSAAMQRTATSLFALAAVVAVPAFLVGEGAEEMVEHLRGVSERAIEQHEEAAEVALWLTVSLGVLSSFYLLAPSLAQRSRKVLIPVLSVLAIASSIDLALVANKGGQIRHPEITNSSNSQKTQD